jgi:hypothetical protein
MKILRILLQKVRKSKSISILFRILLFNNKSDVIIINLIYFVCEQKPIKLRMVM